MRTWTSIALAVAGLLTVTCGNSDAPAPGDGATARDGATLTRVVYGNSNWYGHAPVWAGIRQGIFEKHGFEVEATPFGSSVKRIEALSNDNAQFASLGEVAMLAAMSRNNERFYWIGNQDIAPGNEGLVGVGVTSIEDLRGKRIAVNLNSSVHITTYELLHAAGLDIGKDVTIVKADDVHVVEILRSGDADAGCIWEPYYSQMKAIEGAVVLGTDKDTSIYKRFKTMTGPDVLCASRTWVDADPERARRLFAAYFESVTWCEEHPDELIDLITKRIDKPRDVVATAMGNFIWLDGADQRTVMSDAMLFGQAQYAAEVLEKMNVIESLPAYRNWTRLDLLPE